MALLPAGLQDTLTPYAALDRHITNVLLDRFTMFGYQQVNPPMMEFETTLLAGKGAAYQHNSFRVMDNASGQMLAIRADITPQIERIALQQINCGAPLPIRLCYAGQVLRVNPANMGGRRQLRQAGLELIANPAHIEPLEVLRACIAALQDLGIKDLVVSLAYGGILELLLNDIDEELRPQVRRAILHKDIGALTDNITQRAAIIALLTGDLTAANQHLTDAGQQMVADLQQLITAANNDLGESVAIHADMLDVADFPYHQGACFTLLDRNNRAELGRGGCYLLNNEYAGCGATLYVDNLLRSDISNKY